MLIYILPNNDEYRVAYCDDEDKLENIFEEYFDELYEVLFFSNSPVFNNLIDAIDYAYSLSKHYDNCKVKKLYERYRNFPDMSFHDAKLEIDFFNEAEGAIV